MLNEYTAQVRIEDLGSPSMLFLRKTDLCVLVFQATRPGYSAALYRAYRAVGGGNAESQQDPPVQLFLLKAFFCQFDQQYRMK